MDKNMDWIYRTVPMDPDLEKTLEAVEKALGFKLFVWQKTYIEHGYFRQYGATTAEILRELLNVSEAPLDYTRKPSSRMQSIYREELKEIKKHILRKTPGNGPGGSRTKNIAPRAASIPPGN